MSMLRDERHPRRKTLWACPVSKPAADSVQAETTTESVSQPTATRRLLGYTLVCVEGASTMWQCGRP